jgi:hypothetical protein
MNNSNIAYSNEYQEYRKTFDYVFQDKYRTEIEEIPLTDGNHILRISYFNDESYECSQYPVHTSQTEVYDNNFNKVAEFRNINHSVNFYSVVEHSNGKNYLIFSIDLYGYSNMNLENYHIYNFIPKDSFKGEAETFIWTDICYSKKHNILAVDGCYWACPSSAEFFDFSNPENLPYEKILSSYDIEGELNINTDVIPIRWDDDGSIVLKCCIDTEGNDEVEKVVDIVSLAKIRAI